jgi:hypothetical protein
LFQANEIQLQDFLSFCRTALERDPESCPCADPAAAGALLGWLSGMAAAYSLEANKNARDAESSRTVLRERMAQGLRDHLRGNSSASASREGNGNGATAT